MDNKTIDYYNQNADSFVKGTIFVDFKKTQDKFLKVLPGKRVLDFGCGSGRDTKYFINAGFEVVAIDGSEELCKSASAYTGIQVKHMLFQDLDEMERYDGVWACSSILHLPKDELRIVFSKMSNALSSNGIIYTSFKYGNFEGERNGRFFTDFTLELFKDFISDVKDIVIEEYWITGDVRPGREDEKWLNLILRKIAS
ncbi:class I SAM-dependent methyltransferase [Acetivibrio ethanolgignens]|uniref:Tellurite resistance protein n=1 Tax=Acetivibrio ethanolgignens TaxID=290052 RepID=A0A0V8QIX9_9FIRM|nr:class I SAM-dependent methyltransferase [Acetivibrio ethanolgignens]KSV60516.1 tellurite resistance protein [Acetivibrio ethanolgignens]